MTTVPGSATEGGEDPHLHALAEALEALPFELSGDAGPHLRRRAAATARMLRAIVARTADRDAPLVVVVAGGTGAGKSTTVNTLAGRRVAATGVVRPTTHAPVLVCHPDDEEVLVGSRLLPHLPRVRDDDGASSGQRLVVRTATGLPPGLALVDTPDVDSVEAHNRQLAEDVLDVADAWLWVVTARTYADEAGAQYLRLARDRQVLTAVVVTQVPERHRTEVLDDVERLLAAETVQVDRLLDVPSATVVGELLDADLVEDLRDWLVGLARPGVRAEVRSRALAGLRADLPRALAPIVEAVDAEEVAAERLRHGLDGAFAGLGDELAEELERGIPLRADVLGRWRDLVGGGEVMLRVQTAATRVRTMVRGLLGVGETPPASSRQVRAEVATTLTATLVRLLERAAWDSRRVLEGDRLGRLLLDRHPELRADDGDRPHRVRAAVDAWEEGVADRVATVGADRKVQARVWSTALNALATSAILVVFAVSGGLTGGEVGIAALASAASQGLLVRLLGEQNLRRLLDDARADLDARFTELVADERARLDRAITDASPAEDVVALVRRAGAGRA